jgi:two-component system, NarL family, nitrate/nitrite response regulator NarL
MHPYPPVSSEPHEIGSSIHSQAASTRILIADDHVIFREGLRKLLEAETGLQVVGLATDGYEAVVMARQVEPHVLLLALAMPGNTALEALRVLATSSPTVRAIVLANGADKGEILEALHLGARGVLLKEATAQMLLRSIRGVMAGKYWVGRENVSDLVEALRYLHPPTGRELAPRRFGLTPRELEMIAAVVSGYPNKGIAQKFSISEQTVKHHLTSIYDKLGVHNRLELAIFAINRHLVGKD